MINYGAGQNIGLPVYIVSSDDLMGIPVYFVQKGYMGAKPVRVVDRRFHPEAEPVRLVSPDEVVGAKPVYKVNGVSGLASAIRPCLALVRPSGQGQMTKKTTRTNHDRTVYLRKLRRARRSRRDSNPQPSDP